MVLGSSALSVCHFEACDEIYFDSPVGLHELRLKIQDGEIRLGTRSVVVCLLGRADVQHGRNFGKIFEKFIKTCHTFAPSTFIILTGPFPEPEDTAYMFWREAETWWSNGLSIWRLSTFAMWLSDLEMSEE